MNGLWTLSGQLLSWVNGGLGTPACPGGWLWTTAVVGALLGLAPVLAATAVAVFRRVAGTGYPVGVLALVGLAGCLGALVPVLGFIGVSTVLARAGSGAAVPGLFPGDVPSLQQGSCVVFSQAGYLGSERTVGDALLALPGPDLIVAGRVLALLVTLPLLALAAGWALARLATRGGPARAGLLLWVPMLAVPAVTPPLAEGTVGLLWAGYLAAMVPGSLLVALVGRPTKELGERRGKRKAAEADAEPEAPSDAARDPEPDAPETPPSISLAPEPEPAANASGGDAAVIRLDGQPAPLSPTLAGLVVGGAPVAPPNRPGDRFRRVRPLGDGGFGTVWLAHDALLDRDVALKVASAPDPETEQMIRREARALAAVRHENCVDVYDVLQDVDGVPGLAIVMEYVPGLSLTERLAEDGPLSDTAGAQLWVALAGALDAAHSQEVLHRDVKPANVIIDPSGRAHLIDFGIARAAGESTLTSNGIIVGTPDYLAPEVAAGGPANATADAWQLAATVNFALGAEPPRGHRDDARAALLAAAKGEPVTHWPPDTAHRSLLERALHQDPERRPSLTEVQVELEQWLLTDRAVEEREPEPERDRERVDAGVHEEDHPAVGSTLD